jgi:thymidylate synthase (FAD)
VNSGGPRRPEVEALERVLGERFPILDDGFVRVVDYMGSDAAVVLAARISYGEGTKQVHQDRGLIRYLLRHRHTTPFEMCEIKLHLRVPMDAWRQWIRHRTANVNEYSTRYSIAIDSAQRTDPLGWRLQSDANRQGSEGQLDAKSGRELTRREEELQGFARRVYEERLEVGVAREQARKDLPLSTYTEAYWKIDLHNLLGFLNLRMDDHAQHEIREYARTIGVEIVRRWCPITWEAFLDYTRGSVVLSRQEALIVRSLGEDDDQAALARAAEFGWLDEQGNPVRSRERLEAEKKLESLGFQVPWASR